MNLSFGRLDARALLIHAGLSFLLYQTGLGMVVFAMPLFLLYADKDFGHGLVASGLVLFAIGGVSWLRIVALMQAPLYVVALDLCVPAGLLLGGAVLYAPQMAKRGAAERLLAASAAALMFSLPLYLFIARDPDFEALVAEQVRMMSQAFAAANPAGEQLFADAPLIAEFAKRLVLSTFAAGLFMHLALNWVLAIRWRYRRRDPGFLGRRFVAFTLDERFVWVFLSAWSVVLAGFFIREPLVWFFGWNAGLISAGLYAGQGWGIVHAVSARHILDERMRRAFLGMLLLTIFMPGINVIPIIGLPLLGVSETWINYRYLERSRSS